MFTRKIFSSAILILAAFVAIAAAAPAPVADPCMDAPLAKREETAEADRVTLQPLPGA
jgi:hypothetical protein